MSWRTAQLVLGREDRCAVIAHENRLVIVVADGAGGTGRGASAAESVVAGVRENPEIAIVVCQPSSGR